MSEDITPEQVREVLECERIDIESLLDPKPFPLDWLEK